MSQTKQLRGTSVMATPKPSHPAGRDTAGSGPELAAPTLSQGGTLTPRDVLQLQRTLGNQAVGRLLAARGHLAGGTPPVQRQEKPSPGGLPEPLRSGIERLSGEDMSDVTVHSGSSAPARLGALAFAQGSEIHLGPGQERHLPHEAWHVVQQKQGRVDVERQMEGQNLNADPLLEQEATLMGQEALREGSRSSAPPVPLRQAGPLSPSAPVQRLTGFEVEASVPVYHSLDSGTDLVSKEAQEGWSEEIGYFLFGGLEYGTKFGLHAQSRFFMTADHNQLQEPHRKLIDTLVLTGLLRPETAFRSMSNLEYVTTPRDESAPNAAALFAEDIAAVREHAAMMVDLAKSGAVRHVPLTRDAVLTGVPSKQILTWLEANKADVTLFEPFLDELEKLITSNLYVQKTTGVLPEDFPEFFTQASQSLGSSGSKTAQFTAEVLKHSTAMASVAFMETFSGGIPELFAQHKPAVIGYLAYLGMQLLADSLSLTNFVGEGSSNKNLFPFFPKVSLSQSFEALPEALRTADQQAHWLALVDGLIKASRSLGVAHWGTQKPLHPNPRQRLSSVFKEPGGQTQAPFQADERSKAKETLSALVRGEPVSIGVEKNLEALDIPHPEIEEATGQKAIPVEDRHLGAKHAQEITVANISEELHPEYSEAIVRAQRRLQHTSGEEPDEAQELRERIDTNLAGLTGTLRPVLTALAEQIQQLEQQERGTPDAVTKLKAQAQPLLQQAGSLLRQKKLLAQAIEELKKETPSAKPETTESEGTQAQAPTELEELTQQHTAMQQEYERLVEQVHEINRQKTLLEAQLPFVQARLKRTQQSLEEVTEIVEGLEETLTEHTELDAEHKRDAEVNAQLLLLFQASTLVQHPLKRAQANQGFTRAKKGLWQSLELDKLEKLEQSIVLETLKNEDERNHIGALLGKAQRASNLLHSSFDALGIAQPAETKVQLVKRMMKAAGSYWKIVRGAYAAYQKAEKNS